MDACIINKQCHVFKFHDLLFAYKANHSTVQCVSTIKEIISYYNLNRSPVYMCMLDASKAFDKVNLLLLFNKLRLKGMCPLLLRFIINMYIGQNIRVKWNDCISHVYAVSNGVKQGGVMSPLLFNLYVQDLIECLDRKGLGCHMGNHFSGCFIYADDITLVAPSADALNAMLKVCELYAGEHDITFNSNKTKLMHFTMNNQSPGSIQFMRNKLNVITKCTLLGVEILNNFSADIDHSVKQFNCKYMSLYLDFKYLQCDVLSNMISTYCLDAYASQLWDYEDKRIEKYYVAWRKAMRKVWKLPNLTHCNLLPVITNCLPLNIILEKRLLKFIWSIINSENRIVNNVFKFALNNRRSVLGKNFRYLAFKYKIKCSYWYKNWSYINSCISDFVSNSYNQDVFIVGCTIRELCISRGEEHCLFNMYELEEFIEFLST